MQHVELMRILRSPCLSIGLLALALLAMNLAVAQAAPTQHERFYANGDHYIGTMQDGMRHGRGRYEWAHGTVYEGEYQQDMPHGRGVYTWPNGDQYSGEFAQGVRHGKGRYTWGPGNYYEGQYRFGERTGVGQRIRNGRNVYEGNFVSGMRQGEGMQVEDSGDVFRGWYEDGLRHGLGVRKSPGGSFWLEEWEDGNLLRTWRIERNARCSLYVEGTEWMFLGNRCIDGLAHGAGIAAALDGSRLSNDTHAVLGRFSQGSLRILYARELERTDEQ